MTRILVTGARGLLGSVLVPRLRADGHEVITCSRSGADVHADLTDRSAAASALVASTPDVVVNLAALTDVDACERDPQSAYLSNVRIVENLAAAIRAMGGEIHLVQVSTDQVYDGPGVHAEGDVTLSNCYGFSKYAGELAAATVPSTSLRTNFVGRGQAPGRASLSDWLVAALRRGEPITVFDDVSFSPLRIPRLAELIGAVVAQRHGGVFNVGSHGGMTKADFAFALAGVLGLSTAAVTRGTAGRAALTARRPTNMCMDSTRFEVAFGVTLPRLEDELRLLRDDYGDDTD